MGCETRAFQFGRLRFVVSHPSDKNKGVRWMGTQVCCRPGWLSSDGSGPVWVQCQLVEGGFGSMARRVLQLGVSSKVQAFFK